MDIKVLLLTLLILLSAYFVWHREGPYEADAAQFWLAKEIANDDRFARRIAGTVKNIPSAGAYISNIAVERGIRAISKELPEPGEVKVSLNLAWQAMPGEPALREVLDRTAAQVVTAVLYQHGDISKIRVIIKIPKKRKNVDENRMGKSLGYKNAAKVFSFTRAAWELALLQSERLYDPETPQGQANLLALGDYVVLTDDGWRRGY